MKNGLDPRQGDFDSLKWNYFLWIVKQDFSCIYDDLIELRKNGCRIIRNEKNSHGLRLAPPEGMEEDKRDEFIEDIRDRLRGRETIVNQALQGTKCMMQGIPYKVSLEEIELLTNPVLAVDKEEEVLTMKQ